MSTCAFPAPWRCRASRTLGWLAALPLVLACGGSTYEVTFDNDSMRSDESGLRPTHSNQRVIRILGPWTVFADPYGDGVTPNPTNGMLGRFKAIETAASSTQVVLKTWNLPRNRTFGVQIHAAPCSNGQGGAFYLNVVPPVPNDPAYLDPVNMFLLDFTTNADGRGSATAQVSWVARPNEARSVVITDRTLSRFGSTGARLACLDILL